MVFILMYTALQSLHYHIIFIVFIFKWHSMQCNIMLFKVLVFKTLLVLNKSQVESGTLSSWVFMKLINSYWFLVLTDLRSHIWTISQTYFSKVVEPLFKIGICFTEYNWEHMITLKDIWLFCHSLYHIPS